MTTVTLYGKTVIHRIEDKLETRVEKELYEYFKNLVAEVERAFSDELTNYKFDSYSDFELKLPAAIAKARDVLQRNKGTLSERRYLFWDIWSYGKTDGKYKGIEMPYAVIEITEDGWIYMFRAYTIVAYISSTKSVGIGTEVWYYKYIAATHEPLSDDSVRRYVAKWFFSNEPLDVVHIKVPVLGCVE